MADIGSGRGLRIVGVETHGVHTLLRVAIQRAANPLPLRHTQRVAPAINSEQHSNNYEQGRSRRNSDEAGRSRSSNRP